jgi:hypothetical protein
MQKRWQLPQMLARRSFSYLYFILINGDLVRTIDFDGGISVKDKTQIYLIMIKQ